MTVGTVVCLRGKNLILLYIDSLVVVSVHNIHLCIYKSKENPSCSKVHEILIVYLFIIYSPQIRSVRDIDRRISILNVVRNNKKIYIQYSTRY
ncbi:hypothetical protein HanRHA438_Chr16g0749191 [Helianthus annuus]|nr:hypothetical protein HanIR_Chr16g0801051 [Helianthus annuus]KAJ0834922.1 hypothetical protein HanRHA438_Chr16g0749191 [Helianthus annuus]